MEYQEPPREIRRELYVNKLKSLEHETATPLGDGSTVFICPVENSKEETSPEDPYVWRIETVLTSSDDYGSTGSFVHTVSGSEYSELLEEDIPELAERLEEQFEGLDVRTPKTDNLVY
jgi:hypothetical protein